jgi:transcriptional regulator with XRE-family HTH domain
MQRGEQIAIWRKKRGFTQKELAEKIGVPRSLVAQWESGIRRPHYENMFPRVCQALEVEVELRFKDKREED